MPSSPIRRLQLNEWLWNLSFSMFNTASRPLPVGSIIFSVFALLLVSLVVLLILRRYLPLRTTPGFYFVPIFFAIWLPSVIVLLVPIDLASSAGTDDEGTRGIWLPERVILVSWRITYWLTFALTWYAKPIVAIKKSHLHFEGLSYRFLANIPMPDTENPTTD